MGQLVYILGRSGTGKSYSMRNFPPGKLAVVNVQGKVLPFRGSTTIEATATDQSDKIIKALKIYSETYKSIVVDDYQYVMANEFMRRSAERGFDKFTEIGRHAWDIANAVRELPADVIVYVMCHTDRDDEGNEKIKTIGKLLDEKICLEGMSTIVLKTNVTDGQYSFLTQNNGRDTVKSPAGMFPSYAIDNDLYYVDQKIRNYYSLGEFISDEEAAEIDAAAKKDDIPISDGKKKSRRSRKENDEKEEKSTDAPAKEEKETAEEPPKRSRRQRTENAVDNNSGSGEESDNGPVHEENVEQPRRRRRMSEDPERTAVKEENAAAVANNGVDEDGEEKPFDEVETPELKNPPRRKRRGADAVENPSHGDVTDVEDKTATAPTTSADPVPEETAAPRRRRRRG